MGFKDWLKEKKTQIDEGREKRAKEREEYNKIYDESYRKGMKIRARREGYKAGRTKSGGGFLGGFQPVLDTMGRAGRNVADPNYNNPGFAGFGERPRRVVRRRHKRTSKQPQVIIIGGNQPRKTYRRSRKPSRVEYY